MTKETIIKEITDIWKDVLESEEDTIPTDVTFFELGGNSMIATLMLENLNEKFNTEIELVELYDKNTIQLLADYVETVLEKKDKTE